jgi:mRNA interferase RelE/StbE
MPYRLLYHHEVKKSDIPKLNETMKKRIRNAIEKRLKIEPEKYSEPLRKSLKGYRKLRVGDYQIVLKIERQDIFILGICHRKDVYERMEKRSE